MPQIQLDNRAFEAARRQAAASGYADVGQYVADMLIEVPEAQPDDFDGLFTPDRVAELERIAAEMRAGGRTYTTAEIRQEFEAKRLA